MTTYPPSCQVWIDGKRMADGCTDGEMPADPVVLTDLAVTWGRSNTLDQCDPSSCTFTVMDEGGDPRFTSVLHQGSEVVIKAQANVWLNPDRSILTYDAGFEGMAALAPPPAVTAVHSSVLVTGVEAQTGTRSAVMVPAMGTTGPVRAIFPPAPYGGNTAWDMIPQTDLGQTWRLGASVLTRSYWGAGYRVTVRPAYFRSPTASDYTLGDPIGSTSYSGSWATIVADLVPVAGRWLGVCVEVTPLNVPRWSDVPAGTSWESLGGAPTLTNEVTNPTPASATNWRPNNATYWVTTFNATDKCIDVDRQAAGQATDPNTAGSFFNLGLPLGNPVLPAGANYQRSVEIWTDRAAKVMSTNQGGFVGGQALPANQWTRVVEQFAGAGTAQYVLGFRVQVDTGAPTGVHLKLRRAQLVANPEGIERAYFDGSTPDANGIDYAWTGAANASTSTATDTRQTIAWRDLGGVWIDNLVILSPDTGGVRKGNVFAGRVTDMTARFDLDKGATVVDVIAQSTLAELDNRYVGTSAWLAEKLSTRFDRILDSAGQPNMTWQVDSTVGNVKVSYREPGAEPAASLLQELAQSVGGALWSAHSDLTGSYLWLEDIDRRPATRVLILDPDNVVRIHPAPIVADGESFIELSACDVLLEPVEWVQTTEDDATQVGFTWLQQTVDAGVPKPVSQSFEVTDFGQEAITGRRRLTVSTVLSDYAESLSTANSLLARASTPGWRINGLTISVGSAEQLDNDVVQTMMAVLDGVTRMGLGILLTDIPEWAPVPEGQDVALFLEGGRFRNRNGAWELELLTSSADSQGKATVRWQDLPSNTVTVRTNVAVNPRAISSGADGWLATRGFNTGGAGVYLYATGIAGPVSGVTTARRKQWTQSATAPNNGNSGFEVLATSGSYFPVVAGLIYTVSVWMRHTANTTKTIVLRANYWDASSGGAQVGTTVTGTSTAVPATPGATRTNRTLNPQDRTGGAAGWLTTRGFGTGGAGTYTHNQAVAAPVGNPVTWTACRKTWTTAASNSDLSGINVAADATNWFAVTAGETLTVSCWARHNSTTTKDFALAVTFYDGVAQSGSVAVGTATYGTSVTKAGDSTWARFSVTVTVPAGALGMRVIPDIRGTTATPWNINAWLDVTGLLIEASASVGAYFDGSSTSDSSTEYGWLGTAWASASAANLLTAPWTRLTLTVAPPTGAVGMKVYPDTATAGDAPWAAGETLSATGLLIEEGTPAGAYFDGSSPDATAGTVTTDNEWTGTVNASTSTQTVTDTSTAWSWDEFDPAISWNDLQGVGMP